MTNAEIKDVATRYIINTYGDRKLALVKGIGCYVWDADGNRYLDFLGGLGVNSLGHCHPKLVETLKNQAETLLHVSNLYYIEPQAKLAKLLVENSFADQCFFCNSGAEANEAAIKLARKYAKDQVDPNRYEVITMDNSFHGRTLTTITATGQPKYHKGFEPLMPGFKYVEYDNVEAVEKAVDEKTCAILVEPIQGEGGINVPSEGYLQGLRQICDQNRLLLIFDEVHTAIGRTGKLFGYQTFGVEPDVITMAKGLGGGVPIGCMMTKKEIAQSLGPGTHAATFGGNPLVTAVAHTVLSIVMDEKLVENADNVGNYFMQKLDALKSEFPFIKEVRGKGLIIGLVLSIDGKPVAEKCIEGGLLTICSLDHVIRFHPPLIISNSDVDEAVNILKKALK